MTARPGRAAVLLLGIWMLGVVLATTVGLLAVRLVAEQVGDPAVAPVSAAVAAGAAAGSVSSPRPSQPARRPAGSSRPSAPVPAAGPTTRPTRPTSRPTVGATTRPATGPAAPKVPAPRTSAPTAAAATFRSAGGSVGVQCTDADARLVYATPADGYTLAERSVGGSRVEARFEGEGRRVRMELSCAAGRPRLLEVRTDGDGGSGKD